MRILSGDVHRENVRVFVLVLLHVARIMATAGFPRLYISPNPVVGAGQPNQGVRLWAICLGATSARSICNPHEKYVNQWQLGLRRERAQPRFARSFCKTDFVS